MRLPQVLSTPNEVSGMPSFTSVWKVAKAALCFCAPPIGWLLAADRQVSGTESEPGPLPDSCDSVGDREGEPLPDLERSFPHEFSGRHLPGLPGDGRYSCRRKATRSAFSSLVSFSSCTRLKNSTVSSRVRQRPSCRYGGLSLIPRSVKALIGPSPDSPLRKRSTRRSCIWLSR